MKEREGGKDAERRTGAGKKLIEAVVVGGYQITKQQHLTSSTAMNSTNSARINQTFIYTHRKDLFLKEIE